MKNIIITFAFFSIIGLSTAQSYKNLSIEQNVKNSEFSGTFKWYIKGNKLAFDMSYVHEGVKRETRFIPNLSKNEFILLTLSINMKSYINIADIKPASDFGMIRNIKEDGEAIVSGINCKKIIIEATNSITECFIDTSIDFAYYNYEAFFKSDYAVQALAQLKLKGFPISIITKDLEGNVINTVTTTNIQPNSVSDNIFEVGNQYKTFEELNK